MSASRSRRRTGYTMNLQYTFAILSNGWLNRHRGPISPASILAYSSYARNSLHVNYSSALSKLVIETMLYALRVDSWDVKAATDGNRYISGRGLRTSHTAGCYSFVLKRQSSAVPIFVANSFKMVFSASDSMR